MVTTRKSHTKLAVSAPSATKKPAHKTKSAKKQSKAQKKSEKAKTKQPAQSKSAKSPKPTKTPIPPKPAESKTRKPADTKPKKPAGSTYLGYTSSQLTTYRKHLEDLDSNTILELKEMCRKNSQKVTGTKPELLSRIADGKVLGAIPKCPSCGGGRPKWDMKTATYKCPGYMEDSDFVNCNKKFSVTDIQRSPWQD